MRLDTTLPREATPAGVALVTMPAASSPERSVSLRRIAAVAGDLLGTLAVVLSIPFTILIVGLPIALCVRLLLWLAGLL